MPPPIIRKPSPQIAQVIRALQNPNKEQGRGSVSPVGSTAKTQALPSAPIIQANATDVFTTPGPTQLLYSANEWVEVTLILRTVGPVSVGNGANLVPVQSGRGTVLVTNEPVRFTLGRGTRLYAASTAISRLSVLIFPIASTSDLVAQRQQLDALLSIDASIRAMLARGTR